MPAFEIIENFHICGACVCEEVKDGWVLTEGGVEREGGPAAAQLAAAGLMDRQPRYTPSVGMSEHIGD